MKSKVKIKAEGLCKIFYSEQNEKNTVFKNLNLEIYDEEFVSFIGPSGCGKTTLLNIIAGLETCTEGKILINNQLITKPGADRGMVFQENAIFPWRKVIKNIEYGLEMRQINKQNRRSIAKEYLKLVGLEGFADYYPKELSGGMSKRVAIAMVFANNPDTLLMDEPFGSLDYVTKVELQKELLKIWQKERKTTLFVTHDLEEALFLSDRIFVFDKNSNVVEVVEVPFSRPRGEEVRNSKELLEQKKLLWRYF